MSQLAAPLLFLAACGAADERVPDASMDAFDESCFSRTSYCNPLSQTGCGVGEKCTWIRIDSATGRGVQGCVPDQPPTDACAFGPDGEATGFDDCPAGDICIDGVCQAICVASPDSCVTPTVCVIHDGIFCAISSFGACASPRLRLADRLLSAVVGPCPTSRAIPR